MRIDGAGPRPFSKRVRKVNLVLVFFVDGHVFAKDGDSKMEDKVEEKSGDEPEKRVNKRTQKRERLANWRESTILNELYGNSRVSYEETGLFD